MDKGRINMLKMVQQEIKNVTPSVYAAIAIGLVEEFGWDENQVHDLFTYTQSLWSACAEKNISMRQWCLDLTGIEVQGFVAEKAKAGK